MSDNQKSSEANSEDQPIRHNLVNTAAHFLLNPSVVDKPNENKTAFLRKKGLTDAEIALAYGKAENESKSKPVQNNNFPSNPSIFPPPLPVYRKPRSFWSRLSKISSSLIILGVALFGAHYVYKKYIEPLLFGNMKEDKFLKLEKQLLEMKNTLSQLERHILTLEDSYGSKNTQLDKFLQNEVNEYYPTHLALKELKNEIASVKSLFLNRHQFPALPKVTPPSIPQWQLPSKENDSESIKQDVEGSEDVYTDESNSNTKSSSEINSEINDSIEFINGISETVGNLEAKSAPV